MKRRFLAAILPFVLVGCGVGGMRPGGPGSIVQVVPGSELPPPQVSDLTTFTRPYVIGPHDKLTIDVFGVEELSNQEIQIDASGRLSFPLAGEIQAAGQTPSELAILIQDRLRNGFVRDPQVTVNLKETVSQLLTVDGQVTRPGLYPVVGRMTLMRAVATAQGLNEFARLEDIVVFRTVEGKRMAALYNLKAIRAGYYDDPELYANDVVVVGDSSARRLFRDFLTIAPVLTYPIVTLFQQ